MKRFILAPLAVLLIWFGVAAVPASAQNIYPYQAPRYGPGWQTPMSPYLNLLLPGNTAVNYYGLVQPLFQQRQFNNIASQTLQGMINTIPPPPGILTEEEFNAPMRATGHPVAFNYTGSYFNGNVIGQPVVSPFAQRRIGAGLGTMGQAGRPGVGGMGGMMGGSGVWPNMRPGMGPVGR